MIARLLLGAIVMSVLALNGCQLAPPSTWHEKYGWRAEEYFDQPLVIALCHAIEANDLAEIDRLVRAGADVNAQGKGQMTPLLWAFPDGKLARFQRLLELGADPNVYVQSDFGTRGAIQPGEAVTHLAAGTQFPGYFNAVFDHGGDPNLVKKTQALGQGDTPIFAVIQSNVPDRFQRVRVLLDRGAQIDHINGSELTPVMTAVAWGGQYSLARQLLDAGADPSIYAQSSSNQRLIHLVLSDGEARRPHWPPEQQRDYDALVRWLELNGQPVAPAQQDLARWKSWSISTGEFRRKMTAEVAARRAQADR